MRIVIALLLLVSPALAQTADEARVARACRFDVHLWCADARLRQECLVTRWTKLSSSCQDALVLPSQEIEGAKDQLGTPAK